MHIIIGNYGDDSIAVLQWALEQQLDGIVFLAVDTGWAAQRWLQRTEAARQFAQQHGVDTPNLRAPHDMARLVRDRGSYPNRQFQWCAGLLKGLALNEWLDQHDPQGEALLMMGKRRSASVTQRDLPEYIEHYEVLGERRLWHPLFQHDEADIKALVARSGLAYLGHRSLECEPCIYNTRADLVRMQPVDIQRGCALEAEIGQALLPPTSVGGQQQLHHAVDWSREQVPGDENYHQVFASGCGASFACGE